LRFRSLSLEMALNFDDAEDDIAEHILGESTAPVPASRKLHLKSGSAFARKLAARARKPIVKEAPPRAEPSVVELSREDDEHDGSPAEQLSPSSGDDEDRPKKKKKNKRSAMRFFDTEAERKRFKRKDKAARAANQQQQQQEDGDDEERRDCSDDEDIDVSADERISDGESEDSAADIADEKDIEFEESCFEAERDKKLYRPKQIVRNVKSAADLNARFASRRETHVMEEMKARLDDPKQLLAAELQEESERNFDEFALINDKFGEQMCKRIELLVRALVARHICRKNDPSVPGSDMYALERVHDVYAEMVNNYPAMMRAGQTKDEGGQKWGLFAKKFQLLQQFARFVLEHTYGEDGRQIKDEGDDDPSAVCTSWYMHQVVHAPTKPFGATHNRNIPANTVCYVFTDKQGTMRYIPTAVELARYRSLAIAWCCPEIVARMVQSIARQSDEVKPDAICEAIIATKGVPTLFRSLLSICDEILAMHKIFVHLRTVKALV
jgi:hypothetical protein